MGEAEDKQARKEQEDKDKKGKEEAEKKQKEEAGGEKKAPLDEAKAVLKALEEQNLLMSYNLKKIEKMQAEMLLSGRAPAGQPGLSQEEKDIIDAKKLIAGTGFEDRLFPPKK